MFKCIFYCIRYSIDLLSSSSFDNVMVVYIAKNIRFIFNNINNNIINIIFFYKTNIFNEGCNFFFQPQKQTHTCHLRAFDGLISVNDACCSH